MQLVQYSNAEYVMPFLFVHDIFLPVLKELFQEEKNPVRYVYGTVMSEWSSGRISCYKIKKPETIDKYLSKIIEEYNVTPAFTFTSRNMTKERLNNDFCNKVLDAAYSKNCHFIVASDKLYKHIKSRYKDAKMVCSVIVPSLKINNMFFNETDFYNKMLDKYEIVVLRPEYTMENIDKLDKLIKDLSRVEVLINQICHWNCNVASKHYDAIEAYETGKISIEEYEQQKVFECPKGKPGYKSVCMTPEIIDKLVSMGITKLKIQGRDCYQFDRFFEGMYKFFFNNEIPKEEIRNKVDLICAKLIQENKKAQMIVV